jgi:hypothetical protein
MNTQQFTLPANFTLSHYRLTLEALDPLELPPFKGSALRGGFGHTFKRLACAEPWPCGEHCRRGNACAYGYIFETAPPEDSEVLRTFSEVPRPFVIEPPDDLRTHIPAGERLTFGLTLIGRAAGFLTYFCVVFQELGRQGLGQTRGRFRLERVEAFHPLTGERQPVFDGTQPDRLHLNALTLDGATIAAHAATLSPDRLTLTFLTPARLKHQSRWVQHGPPFDALVKALLGRVSSLSYFHCGQRFDTDFRGLIDRAAGVRIERSETHWEDWARFSGRQKQWVEMGGLVGRVTYVGDPAASFDSAQDRRSGQALRDYLPLLALGQWVHVGKGTVFGNGQYRIERGDRERV